MSVGFVLGYLAVWSSIGALLFSAFVVFVFRSGLVYSARRPDGTLKSKIPLLGLAVMIAFLLSIVAFFVLANYWGLAGRQASVGFGGLFFLNLALYLILFAFDTLFIDGFVLARWRPRFLNLSEQMGRASMREHMLKSIPVGLVAGLLLAGLSATLSFFLFVC